MARFSNHLKTLLAIFSIAVFSVVGVAAAANTGANGKASDLRPAEIVNPEPEKEVDKTKKQEVLNADSLKAAGKISDNAKKGPENQSKVKKSQNASPSIFSYNFVFYLMYKFKIADIFNISKEKNQINMPSESTLIVKGRSLLSKMITRILD